MFVRSTKRVKLLGALVFLAVMMTGTANADIRRYKDLTLARNAEPTSHVLRGYNRGAISLHHIVGSRDGDRNMCMGYGSYDADHIIKLEQRLPNLTLQVRSKYPDTTLAVIGPHQKLYCADDSPSGRAAQLELHDLKRGTYKVWVGGIDQGAAFKYTLKVSQPDAVSQK
ncbi:hypothetical protein C1752_07891 [Acaryochloris thomasi RCC1774]|uniref:Peptidase C-terminal archaeal/bacterial domain-containing protein n=1 Tax=Acaryochloris thomasi RCC1774 TaxID=1764569 RepID=A0A2W1JAK9_9CYAN|nr:hypothetical protein [Acaryochloris thomasi]PZD71163.1 hypothetical protein C1752_07891 [Acaryochloris thomasi RCC1774]